MENETFRARLAKLLQKSRKAFRLYSSMGRGNGGRASEFRDMQVQEWRAVNAELLRRLAAAIENTNSRQLVREVFALRDCFYADWRASEAELHGAHKELTSAVEGGDFVRAANLSLKLIALKARVQAAQAAHHELRSVIDQSKVAQPTIELSHQQVMEVQEPAEAPRLARVIPLLQKGGGR